MKDTNSGEIARERFVETTAQLRLTSLAADLAAYRYKQIILVLSKPEIRREYPPQASYYLGEAYRLRNEAGDQATAEREFNNVIETTPGFAPAHRALGLLAYKRGDKTRARAFFHRYLELAPTTEDRGHIELYLASLDQPAPAESTHQGAP